MQRTDREPSFESVMARAGVPLLQLGRAECDLGDTLVTEARAEVTGRRREHAQRGVTWGYLLGLERPETERHFPAAWTICDRLERGIASAIGEGIGAAFSFSFCKAYSGPVITEAGGVHYEGLHVDTHPGLTDTTDLLRVLINVGDSDRCFRFGDATRVELARAGLYGNRGSFEADHAARHVTLREVRIPARRGSLVSFLVFWASAIPHVGITEAPGYFLYSFEAIAASPDVLSATGG
jgi:hypothetical protein